MTIKYADQISDTELTARKAKMQELLGADTPANGYLAVLKKELSESNTVDQEKLIDRACQAPCKGEDKLATLLRLGHEEEKNEALASDKLIARRDDEKSNMQRRSPAARGICFGLAAVGLAGVGIWLTIASFGAAVPAMAATLAALGGTNMALGIGYGALGITAYSDAKKHNELFDNNPDAYADKFKENGVIDEVKAKAALTKEQEFKAESILQGRPVSSKQEMEFAYADDTQREKMTKNLKPKTVCEVLKEAKDNLNSFKDRYLNSGYTAMSGNSRH